MISPGKKFEIGEQYYFENLGIRHALVGFRTIDINKILENVIFTHLKTAGYDVTIGQIGKREINFFCEKREERLYIQAAYLMTSYGTGNLETFWLSPTTFPPKVVTMDPVAGGSYQGIEHVYLEDFLLSL